jgi:predicted dehydrogenase
MPDEERKIRHWTAFKATSGDFIVEQDCHGLDVLNWFAQAHPLKAIGDGGRRARKYGDISDHALVSYEYPGGLRGWLLGTQLPPNPYWNVKEEFIGTLGCLETSRHYYSFFQAGKGQVQRVESKPDITTDAVAAFFAAIVENKPFSMVRDAAESTLTSILGRMACERRREVTWEEMMK